MDFVIAGLAAVCAGLFTNPLEVLKIRMQLQGELQKKGEHTVYYKNILQAGYVVAKNDGVLALQRGLTPALWVQLVMNGLRLGTYEQARSRGYITDSQGNIVFSKHILVGGCCGVLGQFSSSPLYMIKTHFQAQAAKSIAVGYQHDHGGMWMALRKIFGEYGIKGLFRGAGAAMPRAFIASTSQLTAFTYSKEKLTKYDILGSSPYLKSFIASLVGGVAISTMVAPFDLVSIRLILKIRGLWRGVNATMLRALVGSSSQLTSFAMAKDYLKTYQVFDKSPIVTSFAASVVGGIFQVLTITPFDLISTRLYNQPVDAQGRGLLYKSIPDCFLKIWKTEGFFGFYKGVTANYMRLAPHGALTLVFWDMLKDLQVSFKNMDNNA